MACCCDWEPFGLVRVWAASLQAVTDVLHCIIAHSLQLPRLMPGPRTSCSGGVSATARCSAGRLGSRHTSGLSSTVAASSAIVATAPASVSE